MQQPGNYNSVSKFLHWSIAILIIGKYFLGLTLDYTYWCDIHKQIGLANAIVFVAFVHALIALIHHYKLKDELLDRMLPYSCSKK